MLIRAAGAADAARIAALVREYWEFEGIEGFELARVTKLLEDFLDRPEHGGGWVAESQGQLHGYLIAVFMFSLEHGGTMAEIDEFFVKGSARSAGLGAKLLSAAERDMAGRGIIQLQLQVGAENIRGQDFYRRHGFGTRSGYALLDKALR